MVRCKFKCTTKTENENGFTITLVPVTNGSAENREFFKYTPFGKMEIGTVNNDVAKHLIVNQEYFIDLTPVSSGLE